ncbi:MAG: heavy metal response regulator transcription factor [Chthoniobacteraceae bacterium]|jgi:two-component system copper resistance phosphate regulon response regulator CusR
MRVLIVEDERKTAAFIQKGLPEHGFLTTAARDGEEGLDFAITGDFGVLIVDVMLPIRNGWSLIQQLRAMRIDTPVLFLTARDSVEDRVKGLELGADDYLVKPFAFSELLARVRTLLRRAPARQPERYQVGDLDIDLPRRHASRAGHELALTPKEFLLLSHLAKHAGDVLSRDNIVEHVWDIHFDPCANVIDVMIRRLRAKVDHPFDKKLIHTVRGVGYLLRAE